MHLDMTMIEARLAALTAHTQAPAMLRVDFGKYTDRANLETTIEVYTAKPEIVNGEKRHFFRGATVEIALLSAERSHGLLPPSTPTEAEVAR